MIRPRLLLAPASPEPEILAAAIRPWLPALAADPRRLARGLARGEVLFDSEGAAVLLQGLSAVDEYQIRAAGPGAPRLRDLIRVGAVRYQRSDPGEHWQTWGEILPDAVSGELREGDCEDLSAATAAELRVDGWDPWAYPVAYRAGPRLSHVVVRAPRYRGYIDPSRLAGM